jgi:hypothetical protein
VYRLFFISKAPSFYIIRSSLVLTGGVYGEQVTKYPENRFCEVGADPPWCKKFVFR